MTWGEYVTLVEEQLSVDAERRGLENFRAQQIRNSVIDLQRYIRGYRQGHTTTYTEDDLEPVGCAHQGQLPSGAIPEAFYIMDLVPQTNLPCDNESPRRNRLDFWNWKDRYHLTNGATCDHRLYAYAISPFSRYFLVHPLLNDETELILVWEGLKRDFIDGDTVPWPEEASEASAAYVKWRIALEINRDAVLARELQAIFASKRLALFRDFQEKLDAEKVDEEQPSSEPPIPPPFINTGAQGAIFLRNITSILGSGSDALAAITTTDLSLPFLVELYIGGNLQRWLLTASTDATDVPGGIARPNDFDGTSNARVWHQLS